MVWIIKCKVTVHANKRGKVFGLKLGPVSLSNNNNKLTGNELCEKP